MAESPLDESAPIDFVLVYGNDDTGSDLRAMFEAEVVADGLRIDRLPVDSRTFVVVHCPFDRMCKEAERVRLEMPLKDVCVLRHFSTNRVTV